MGNSCDIRGIVSGIGESRTIVPGTVPGTTVVSCNYDTKYLVLVFQYNLRVLQCLNAILQGRTMVLLIPV
jgi:hypothetical protein